MGNRSKYKKVTDLYRRGAEVVFEDGTVMYLQAMNPFEVDDARRAASVAKARLALSVSRVGSEEHDMVMSNVEAAGAESAIKDMLNAKAQEHFMSALFETQVDEDWKERWEVIERSEEIEKFDEDHPERKTLAIISEEFFQEVHRRQTDLQDMYRGDLEALTHEELVETYSEEWVTKRGQARALDAYNRAELLTVCRNCDATVPAGDEKFDHSACDHSMKAFEDADLADIPEEMYQLIQEGIERLSMTVREAKN